MTVLTELEAIKSRVETILILAANPFAALAGANVALTKIALEAREILASLPDDLAVAEQARLETAEQVIHKIEWQLSQPCRVESFRRDVSEIIAEYRRHHPKPQPDAGEARCAWNGCGKPATDELGLYCPAHTILPAHTKSQPEATARRCKFIGHEHPDVVCGCGKKWELRVVSAEPTSRTHHCQQSDVPCNDLNCPPASPDVLRERDLQNIAVAAYFLEALEQFAMNNKRGARECFENALAAARLGSP